MNYLPFLGYWFYGATDAEQRAAYFSSWGLLAEGGAAAAADHFLMLLNMGT